MRQCERDIEIHVHDILPFSNERYKGFIIQWSSSLGWGEYSIYYDKLKDAWYGDSECMDKEEDKKFLFILLTDFINQVRINA